jgi:hypothetical protein
MAERSGHDGPQKDNPQIPAAYTHLGQFVDHDITFDPVSQLQRFNDPDALRDFRTPRFDLDCVYGRGPADDPYLYEWTDPELRGVKLLAARNPAGHRALIGHPRNDENIIVSQLQLAFIKFHDRRCIASRRERTSRAPTCFRRPGAGPRGTTSGRDPRLPGQDRR